MKGFEGKFEVSDLGRVKALPWEMRHWCGRMIPQPEKIVTQSRHSGGYAVVSLRDGKKHYVHRLVMQAFAGEPPMGMNDVNHIDGSKKNNCRTNLEYCDRQHNVRHAISTGLQDNVGESNGMSKLTSEQAAAIYRLVASGSRRVDVAAMFRVSCGTVDSIATRKRWAHLNMEHPAA